jgi:polyisoprenoid-binding protein YceI
MQRQKHFLLPRAVGALILSLPIPASADSFTIDERHTFPGFEISHIGFSTQRGRFDKTTGKITLEPQKKTGSIHIVIDADSIDTGLAELEDRLKKEDFFNTAKYPAITYDADKIVFEGEKPARIEGNLTLLGVSKPVALDIRHFRCGIHPLNGKSVCGADASGAIKRSDFGMTAFLPAIGDEVRILIQVEGFKE